LVLRLFATFGNSSHTPVKKRMKEILSFLPKRSNVYTVLRVNQPYPREYGVETSLENLPFAVARWVVGGWDCVVGLADKLESS
jgi:hypothetical protein